MEKKEGIPFFLKVLLIVLIILLLDSFYFFYKSKTIPIGMTGFSVQDTVYESFLSLPPAPKAILIVQWVFILFMLLFALFKDIFMAKSKAKEIYIQLQKNKNKNSTDLDTLYETLKQEKELTISAISRAFNIDKEIAMDWCKILESGELITIDYPAFGQPIIRINEKDLNNTKSKKSEIERVQKDIKEKPAEQKDLKPIIALQKRSIKKAKSTQQYLNKNTLKIKRPPKIEKRMVQEKIAGL